MEMLRLDKVNMNAGDFAMHNISFSVDAGAYFILLGPSGAGKSLILELIAGFYQPTQGSIFIKRKEITAKPVQEREVGLLFQDFAIFPHLSVFDNIAFPVRKKIKNKNELADLVFDTAASLEVSHLLRRNPSTLSGGEQQRVALARTLIRKPAVLLLDEPLAALDVQLRGGIRSLLRQLNQNGQTIIHVTHDYEEAAILGHRIAVVENNTIAQCGSHDEVFHHPRSEFIANFVGIRNFFIGRLLPESGHVRKFLVNSFAINILTDSSRESGFAVIRSEDIFLSSEPIESSAANNLEGVVRAIEPARLGFEISIDAGIPLIALVSKESISRMKLETGKKVWAGFKASAVRFVED
ncbi:MAG TPA: ABC transporter ATP-binding protein [Bacteroidales bacterium]|nr:ABC transporter ATP-binding protein [Bacteroidales bacterium]